MPRAAPRRVTLLPLAAVLVIVLAAAGAILLSVAQTRANEWIVHTLKVEADIAALRASVRRVESAHRGYLIGRDNAYLSELDLAAETSWRRFEALRVATVDNREQRRAMIMLRPKLARKIAYARASTASDRVGEQARQEAMTASARGRAFVEAIEADLNAMQAREEALFVSRINVSQWIVRLLAMGLAIAVLLTVFFALLNLRDARRRERALAAAHDDAEDALARLRAEIAARGQAEDRIRQMQKMETVGQLTGGIAHDFNNMLAIVIGSLDMAERRGDDPEKRARYLANAREGAERAAALTARLLAFSRQQPLAPNAIDANRMVSGMSELLRRTLGEQIEIETVLAGGLWPAFADASQLENAILNLAVNARDAMLATEAGGGRLTIETANAHLDDDYARDRGDVLPGQYVLVCVSDTGVGMTPEVIERAFDPFFTTKEVGKGTGLGLSQVFGFVKQSGGHVAIYSEPGQGTTVKLYMPRARGGAVEGGVRGKAEAIPGGTADEIILVVEDEPRVRHFSIDALRELGYTVLSTESPSDALRVLAEQPSVTLLFTDVVMPEMDGRRLADRAVEMRPGLRVLYTTGYTRNAVVHNGMLDMGVAFLPKPFTIAQLALKVRQVLDTGGANRNG